MKANDIRLKIEKSGLITVSVALALIYWRIETMQLGAISTRIITFLLFIVYGIFTQYLINSNKRMAEEISALSMTDPLTNLYNRRGFMTLAEHHVKIADRTKNKAMLVLFADLDQMKSINDTLGHEKGDKALIEVASILKEVFRSSDIIARIGGDEFAVLAIGATIDVWGGHCVSVYGALENRLQHQIDIHNAIENREYKISLSVGLAHSDIEGSDSIEALMSRADASMYEQKRAKRL